MPKNYVNQPVAIQNGFPGTYSTAGGTAFYLNGDSNAGEIHFTVNPNQSNKFSAFHLTRSVDGSNVGIWYNEKPGGGLKPPSPNTKNLPGSKEAAWKKWWSEHEADCNAAALDFWNAF